MSTAATLQNAGLERRPSVAPKHIGLLLQRKCACGAPTASMTGECAECKDKKRLQTKLAIGASHDPLEQEADRVADEVLATPARSSVSASPPRIQRFTGQSADEATAAPASVDRVLAGSGSPLAPALQLDMEHRFGYDFSQVRVHADAAASQSAQDVNAHAYTVGQDIVFGAGRFAPGTHHGRRLIAHELTHVVQQTSSGPEQHSHAGTEKKVQREPAPKQDPPSSQLSYLAQTAIDELDDDQRKKVLLGAVVSAAKLGELPAFTSILKAKTHKTYGNYFIFLFNELESDNGSQSTVGLLRFFVDANVDVTKELNTSNLQPLAAVAKFKTLAQRYKALLSSGKVSDAEKQRIGKLIADAQDAIRDIEPQSRKPGVTVQAMGGGVAVAAGTLWKTAGVLAADDATGIGVADDVLIPFVIVGAAVLSGIALFAGGPKPVMLDYRPAMDKVNSALMAIAAAVEVAVQSPRPRPRPPQPRPEEKTPPPKEVPATPQPRPQPKPQPKPTKTIDVVPTPPTATEQDKDDKKKRKRCRPEQELCETPLPIKWPAILPLPRSSRPLIRTPSGDPYIEPEARSGVQEELQRYIRRARAEGRLPPNLCNQDDALPNAPYDAHHVHPLFLGGAEDWVNVCALRADYHQDGHPLLYDQRDMLTHPVWIACKVCQGNLRRHPALQEYEIEGRK